MVKRETVRHASLQDRGNCRPKFKRAAEPQVQDDQGAQEYQDAQEYQGAQEYRDAQGVREAQGEAGKTKGIISNRKLAVKKNANSPKISCS